MEFIEATNPEWQDMWAGLAEYPPNRGDAICLHDGECWEYMGSSVDHHHFRHLHHPFTAKAEFAYIERRRAVIGWV